MDETDVCVAHTFNPSSQTVEDYNYPFPGSKNATSTLKLLNFSLSNGQVREVHGDDGEEGGAGEEDGDGEAVVMGDGEMVIGRRG